MSMVYEARSIDGVEIFHTFRGHNGEVEVYTFQDGGVTYSLFKRPGDDRWRCDWTASYNHAEIELDADPASEGAMLSAFVQMLKKRVSWLG